MQIRPTALHVIAGTTLFGTGVIEDEGGPVDLASAVLRLEIAPKPRGAPSFAYQSDDVVPFITIESAEDGEFSINVPPDETSAYRGGSERWYWRLLVIHDDGNVTPAGEGPLMVSAELVPKNS